MNSTTMGLEREDTGYSTSSTGMRTKVAESIHLHSCHHGWIDHHLDHQASQGCGRIGTDLDLLSLWHNNTRKHTVKYA